MKTKNNIQAVNASWRLNFGWLLVILIAFSACKTTKLIPVKTESKPVNQIAQLIEQVQKKQAQFTTANVSKMSLELEMGGRSVNVSANCKMKLDSVIYLSAQIFGIELFKAEFTADSIRVFDKTNRRYYTADYSYFATNFGVDVDFFSLQSLLTGRFFCVGNKAVNAELCKLNDQKQIEYTSKNMIQTTTLNAQSLIQQMVIKAINGNYQLQTVYSDYTVQNGVNFPGTIALQLGTQNTQIKCSFSILRTEFNSNLKFVPTNKVGYTRANLDQLLNK